jgi:hypothetical protein
LADGIAEPAAGFVAIGGGEDRPDNGPERVVLVLAGVATEIPEEVHVMPTSA